MLNLSLLSDDGSCSTNRCSYVNLTWIYTNYHHQFCHTQMVTCPPLNWHLIQLDLTGLNFKNIQPLTFKPFFTSLTHFSPIFQPCHRPLLNHHLLQSCKGNPSSLEADGAYLPGPLGSHGGQVGPQGAALPAMETAARSTWHGEAGMADPAGSWPTAGCGFWTWWFS